MIADVLPKMADGAPKLAGKMKTKAVPRRVAQVLPVAVETFEKIQLSPSSDNGEDHYFGDDESPGHSPPLVLTSSLEPLIQSSRRQHHGSQGPGAERSSQNELAEEEVGEEPQGEDSGNGCFDDSVNAPCEVPCHTAAIVTPLSTPPPTLPVRQSNRATVCRRLFEAVPNDRPSTVTDTDSHDGDDDEDKDNATPWAVQEFGMKQQFDEVVQELLLFFAIGAEDPSDPPASERGSVMNRPEGTGHALQRELKKTMKMTGQTETATGRLPDLLLRNQRLLLMVLLGPGSSRTSRTSRCQHQQTAASPA
ncbi:hypothetical protein CRUP_021464 [Coryphaenoides rupestris]|nr:hypothetical protein CRUP_021464 [Coryphaenoides rupestris]